MRYTKSDIKPHPIPKISDLQAMKRELFMNKIKERIEGGIDRKFIQFIEEFTENNYSAIEIAAALFQMELELENVKEIDSVDNAKAMGRDRNDRGERSGDRGGDRGGDRSKGKPRGKTPSGMIRMHINVGNNHNVRPRDIVGAIANEAGIEGRLIGSVDIFDTFTFVEIPESHADRVIERMDKRMIKGKPVSVIPAKEEKGGYSKSKPSKYSGEGKKKVLSPSGALRSESRDRDRDRDKKRVKTPKTHS